MKLALKKYALLELLVVAMIFMVIFLSSLVNGLGRAVSSSLEWSLSPFVTFLVLKSQSFLEKLSEISYNRV
ncbi:hypothetical protein [Streptococcus porcorum]|uniref:Uncharacterized protein n=1 Tax=Streptococcus porcorum TaxID=701526 RepID=A0ABV2JER1_9STRE